LSAVFISYRRGDAAADAGRLADALAAVLGRARVFRDIGSIDAGEHFDAALDAALQRASHVLVLIGPGWLDELRRRLPLADADFVRLEVAQAFSAGKTVLPVLVRGATLPAATDLPEELAELPRCQAAALRDDAWAHDIGRLLDAIGRPYRRGMLALRALIAVPAIVGIGAMAARAANLDFADARMTIAAMLLLYGGLELALWLRHRRRGLRRASAASVRPT